MKKKKRKEKKKGRTSNIEGEGWNNPKKKVPKG